MVGTAPSATAAHPSTIRSLFQVYLIGSPAIRPLDHERLSRLAQPHVSIRALRLERDRFFGMVALHEATECGRPGSGLHRRSRCGRRVRPAWRRVLLCILTQGQSAAAAALATVATTLTALATTRAARAAAAAQTIPTHPLSARTRTATAQGVHRAGAQESVRRHVSPAGRAALSRATCRLRRLPRARLPSARQPLGLHELRKDVGLGLWPASNQPDGGSVRATWLLSRL